MAAPPAYTRAYSFTDFETLHPADPKPGDKLDTEYDAVSNALTATQTNLALIQRDDGALANESVGVDQLQPGLFDGIGDAAAADADASASAAAASASAAATSAAAAAASAASVSADAASAAGSASAASGSQGIAQGAADDAAASAAEASLSADAAATSANDSQTYANSSQGNVDLSYKWAEYLAAPVMPAPAGYPEAVDDGMWSSKWWAIRARDYNSVHHIDLGTAGANVGEAFDIWDLTHDLPLGLIYATWGTPPNTYALTDPSNPSDPASWTDITGGPGPAGPPNTLTIGTVTSGTPAAATITGASPNQVLSLTIPPGATGATGATGPAGPTGAAGPPNTLNIGTVTTGAPGSAAAATITGAAPSQTLSLTIPAGATGAAGPAGATGPAGPSNFAAPSVPVGLTMIPGVSTNAMRADGAPALDQAIAPTWAGAHTFNALVNLAGPVQANSVDGISGQVLASQGAGQPTVWRTPGGGAIELIWNFSVSVGTANPGSQKMSLNSAVYTSVTTAVFNALAQTNFDANAILGLLQAGNRIYMQQRNDATKAVVYQVTGPATNAGGYWTVPVTHVNSLGVVMFPANADIVCVFIMSASTSTTYANPTASVGLAAVNGVLSTAMRSDSAPALSQAIVPTWTGFHTFSAPNNTGSTGAAVALVSAQPNLIFNETDQGTDAKAWRQVASGSTFAIQTLDDAGATARSVLNVTRAAVAVSNLSFGNATDNPTYSFLGTGATALGGDLSMARILTLSSTAGPLIRMVDGDAGTDTGRWRLYNNNGTFSISTENDSGTLLTSALSATRTTGAVTNVTLGNGTDNPSYTLPGTGVTTHGGSIVVGAPTGGSQGVGTINATGLYVNGVAVGGGGGTPAGSTTQIQFNNAGAFGADANFTWTSAASVGVLTIGCGSGFPTVKGADSSTGNPTSIEFRGGNSTFAGAAGGTARLVGGTHTDGNGGAASVFGAPGVGTNRSGGNVGLTGGAATGTGNGGSIIITAGTGGAGGQASLTSGTAVTVGTAGPTTVISGGAPTDGAGGGVTIQSSNGAGTNRASGAVLITSGGATGNATAGSISLTGGVNSNTGGFGASISIAAGAGNSATGGGGQVVIAAGISTSGAAGSILLRSGVAALVDRLFINGNGSWGLATSLAVGTSGQVLTSQAAAPPIWSNPALVAANFATPTASLGLAAFAGSAVTAMRSDGAPALSQSIAPTWTAQHVFTQAATGSGGPVYLSSTQPGISFNVTGQATDAKMWIDYAAGASRIFATFNDAGSTAKSWLNVTRSVNTIASLAFGNATDNPSYTFLGTGTVTAAAYNTTSTRAIKRETGAPSKVRDILARLRPIMYRLLAGDDREQLGLIAEEVHEVCPQLSDGKTVSYDRLALLLLAAWQDENVAAA